MSSSASQAAVRVATRADFDRFVALAAEVENLFGPMVGDAGFRGALARNIERESALLAFDDAGTVAGGLPFSRRRAPDYAVGWLVVAAACRSRGIGADLLADAVQRWVEPPADISVVTFGADHPGARSRRFYERLGFVPGAVVERGPEGGSRQQFALRLESLPKWARR